MSLNRRSFIKHNSIAALGGLLTSKPSFFTGRQAIELDKYGGWKGKHFMPTGFFRVVKEDRWWIVTPEGNAFLSFGINHFHGGWWKQAYNQEKWMKKLGVSDPDKLDPALRRWLLETCKTYGFNTVGVHSDLKILNQPQAAMPYMQPIQFVDISHWKNTIKEENFVDIFSDKFYHHCDQMAKDIALPLKEDSYLLGYSMADCPLFTEEDCRERPDTVYGGRREGRIGWPRKLRNLGSGAAAKQAYVKLMHELYQGSIELFNHTYQTKFNTFDELQKAEQWRPLTDLSNPNESRDNVSFLQLCVDQYYKTAKEAIHRYDPNHLFFGDKLNGNTDTVDTVLPITSKYTDVMMYQMYAKYDIQKVGLDKWSRRVDIPIINGDSAYTHIRDLMPQPYGPIADSAEENAQWTWEFFQQAFARPEFVGWHVCGLIDTPVKLVKKESNRQHSGMFNGYGEVYPELGAIMKKCGESLYQ